MGNYLDVAVRDLVMGIGAFTLARLTEMRAPEPAPSARVGGPAHATTG